MERRGPAVELNLPDAPQSKHARPRKFQVSCNVLISLPSSPQGALIASIALLPYPDVAKVTLTRPQRKPGPCFQSIAGGVLQEHPEDSEILSRTVYDDVPGGCNERY